MLFISFKEGIPKDHSVGKEHLNSAAGKVSSISLAQCNEAWSIGNRTFGLTLVQTHVLSVIQQLTGSNAFISPTYIDTANLTNTYINFKNAGSGGDWCCLSQIGGNEKIKLELDFHDDIVDGRLCIRSFNDYTTPDTIK